MSPDSMEAIRVAITSNPPPSGWDWVLTIVSVAVTAVATVLAAWFGAREGGRLAAAAGRMAIREEFEREREVAREALRARILLNLPRLIAACERVANLTPDDPIPFAVAEELEVLWNTYLRRAEEHISRLETPAIREQAERVFSDAHVLVERAKKAGELAVAGLQYANETNKEVELRKLARRERDAIIPAMAQLKRAAEELERAVIAAAETPKPDPAPPDHERPSRAWWRSTPVLVKLAYLAFAVALVFLLWPGLGLVELTPWTLAGACVLRFLGSRSWLSATEVTLLVLAIAQSAEATLSMGLDKAAHNRAKDMEQAAVDREIARDKREDARLAAERAAQDSAVVEMVIGALRVNAAVAVANDSILKEEIVEARKGIVAAVPLRPLDVRWWDMLAANVPTRIAAQPMLLDSLRIVAHGTTHVQSMADLRLALIVNADDKRRVSTYDATHLSYNDNLRALLQPLAARLEALR
jgi:hypothetical protein